MNSWSLVLNKNWVAITTIPIYRTFQLLCRNRAVAICPESYEQFDIDLWIRRSIIKSNELESHQKILTPTMVLEKPEVIRLVEYGGIPYVEVNFSRKHLYRRDNNTCQYCNKQLPFYKLTIDHVWPRSRGGGTSFENCVTCCEQCNVVKADRTLRESRMTLIKQPEKPKWNPIMGFLPRNYPESWNKLIGKCS